MASRGNKYKFRSFIFDALLVCLTGGLWLIRIYVREKRR